MASLPSQSSSPHGLLICGVCEELYDDATRQAKFLTCHHTFCSECLRKLSNKEQVKQATIECPNCRCHTRVPENGIDGLQTNFYITSWQESQNIQSPKAFSNEHPNLKHNAQPISSFCVTCGLSINLHCALADHTIKDGHSVINVPEEETAYFQELNNCHKALTQNKRNLKLVESEIASLNAAKNAAIKDIETFIKLAYEKLEQRQTDLVKEAMDQFDAQQNVLLDLQKQITWDIERLNGNINQAKNVTTNGDINKLKTIFENLKRGNEKTQSTSNLELGENYLVFDSNIGLDEFNKCLSALGKIYTNGFLPSIFAFKSTKAKKGHTATLTVKVCNHHGDKISAPSVPLSVKVTDPMNAEVHTGLCTTGSDYTVTFLPLTSGLHKVSGVFLGQELVGEQSHISVSSNNAVLKFGEYGPDGIGNFKYPWSIAIDNNNCLYVTDTVNKLIQKFTPDGQFLSQFNVAVHNKDCSTTSIALDLDNRLIYCPEITLDHTTLGTGSNLLVFNLEGDLQHTCPLSEAQRPYFIAMNSHKDLIITDIGNNSVSQVNTEGNFLRSLGDFKTPGHVAIDDEDNIIVPDTANHCICIFDPNGKLRQRFGTYGDKAGEFQRPFGIATDGENILVVEEEINRIQVFGYDGRFVSMIKDEDDPFDDPRGLAVSKDGHVYVADSEDDCIRKYKYRDLPSDKGSDACIT